MKCESCGDDRDDVRDYDGDRWCKPCADDWDQTIRENVAR